MSKINLKPEQINMKNILGNSLKLRSFTSFKIGVFPVYNTSMTVFARVFNHLKKNLYSIPMKNKEISVEYYVTTPLQLQNLITQKQNTMLSQRVINQQSRVKLSPVASLQISPFQNYVYHNQIYQFKESTQQISNLKQDELFDDYLKINFTLNKQYVNTQNAYSIDGSQLAFQDQFCDALIYEDLCSTSFIPSQFNCDAYIGISEFNEYLIDKEAYINYITRIYTQFMTLQVNNQQQDFVQILKQQQKVPQSNINLADLIGDNFRLIVQNKKADYSSHANHLNQYKIDDETKQLLYHKSILVDVEQTIHELVNKLYEENNQVFQKLKQQFFNSKKEFQMDNNFISQQSVKLQFYDLYYPINKFSNKVTQDKQNDSENDCLMFYNYDYFGDTQLKKCYNYNPANGNFISEDDYNHPIFNTYLNLSSGQKEVDTVYTQNNGQFQQNIIPNIFMKQHVNNPYTQMASYVIFPQFKNLTKTHFSARILFQYGNLCAQMGEIQDAILFFKCCLQIINKQELSLWYFCNLYIFLLNFQTIKKQIQQLQERDKEQLLQQINILYRQTAIPLCAGLINTSLKIMNLLLQIYYQIVDTPTQNDTNSSKMTFTQRLSTMFNFNTSTQTPYLLNNAQITFFELHYKQFYIFNQFVQFNLLNSTQFFELFCNFSNKFTKLHNLTKFVALRTMLNKPVLNIHEIQILDLFVCQLLLQNDSTPQQFMNQLVINNLTLKQFKMFYDIGLFLNFTHNYELVKRGFFVNSLSNIQNNQQNNQIIKIKKQQQNVQQIQSFTLSYGINNSTNQSQMQGSSQIKQQNIANQNIIQNINQSLYQNYYKLYQQFSCNNTLPLVLQSTNYQQERPSNEYCFNDFKVNFYIYQQIPNTCNNISVVQQPQQCYLQSQIDAYNNGKINKIEYQKIYERNEKYQQIFMSFPIQIQLALDRKSPISNYYKQFEIKKLKFNHDYIKPQIISQYYDSVKFSLFVDVQFLIQQNNTLVSEKSPDQIFDDLENEAQNDFVCELFELIGISIQFGNFLFCTEIKNAKFILYNKYVYLQISNVQNLNQIQFEQMFGYSFLQFKEQNQDSGFLEKSDINIQKIPQPLNHAPNESQIMQQQQNQDLLLFDFEVNYVNIDCFRINPDKEIHLFADIQQERLKEKTLSTEVQQKNEKLRSQSLYKSQLVKLDQSVVTSQVITNQQNSAHLSFSRQKNKNTEQNIQLLTMIDNIGTKTIQIQLIINPQRYIEQRLQALRTEENKHKKIQIEDIHFCFNFMDQVMKISIYNFQKQIKQSDSLIKRHSLYNGHLYQTNNKLIGNSYNKLLLKKQHYANQNYVFIQNNEQVDLAFEDQYASKQYFDDALAKIGISNLIVNKIQTDLINITPDETFQKLLNGLQSNCCEIIKIETYNCFVQNSISKEFRADSKLEVLVFDGFRLILNLKFLNIDLIKVLVIE